MLVIVSTVTCIQLIIKWAMLLIIFPVFNCQIYNFNTSNRDKFVIIQSLPVGQTSQFVNNKVASLLAKY